MLLSKGTERDFSLWKVGCEIRIKQNFTSSTNKLAYPITLPSHFIDLINNNSVSTLSLLANDLVLFTVNIKKYPQSLGRNNEFFIPFFSDKYFNIYTLNSELNTISIEAETTDFKRYNHVIIEKKEEKESPLGPSLEKFLIRTYDGNFIILQLSNGAYGFPISW